MKDITEPSIGRIARKAGVKSMSSQCYDTVRQLIENKLDEITATLLVVNSERQIKTIMASDVYNALALLGHNITESGSIGTKTVLHKCT